MKYDRIKIDIAIKTLDEGHGLGAHFRVDKETVGIASLYFPINEYKSQYAALRKILPELLRLANARKVVFMGEMYQFMDPSRLYRTLDILANQEGKEVRVYHHKRESDARRLMNDALVRKESIIEIF